MSLADAVPEPSAPETPVRPDLAGSPDPADARDAPPRAVPAAVPLALLLVLMAFVAYKTPHLVAEIRALRQAWYDDAHSRIIGYEGINPRPSYARKPDDWFRHEGESTMLWAEWRDGLGHRWFRVGRGELERDRLSWAIGRDVLRAIDRPVFESDGGVRWERLPDDTPVFGHLHGPTPTAYPSLVLQKVMVVNEAAGEAPLLLVYTPHIPLEESVSTFDPRLDGRRITLGSTGYLYGVRPLLYDRGTESLWAQQDAELVAVAGPLRGSRLPASTPATLASWSDWQSRYPHGRLVVGADRREPPPAD